MSEAYLYGQEPPRLISFTSNKRFSNGKAERDVTILYFIYLRNREAFVNSLPDVLEEDSLNNVLGAETLAARGIVSADYKGLELGGVTDSGEGKTRILTITYSTPADGETDTNIDDMSDADLKWWTSTTSGKVYHERKKIKCADSEKYSEYALQTKFGLQPNGANMSPEEGSKYCKAEATWGPEEDEEPYEDDPENPDANAREGHAVVDAIFTNHAMESVPLEDESIAYGMGLMRADMGTGLGSHGITDLMNAAIAIEKGSLKQRTISGFFSESGDAELVWAYDSPNPMDIEPFSNSYFTPEEAAMFGKAVSSRPHVQVPVMTVSIRKRLKCVTMTDIMAGITKAGEEMDSITVRGQGLSGGTSSIRPPEIKLPDKYAKVPIETKFVYLGRSHDTTDKRVRYRGARRIEFKEVVYTDVYKTVTKQLGAVNNDEQ